MTEKIDCVKMKNDIQAKIHAETKGMSFKELKAYLSTAPSIIRDSSQPEWRVEK